MFAARQIQDNLDNLADEVVETVEMAVVPLTGRKLGVLDPARQRQIRSTVADIHGFNSRLLHFPCQIQNWRNGFWTVPSLHCVASKTVARLIRSGWLKGPMSGFEKARAKGSSLSLATSSVSSPWPSSRRV